jgi:hypothetical protein
MYVTFLGALLGASVVEKASAEFQLQRHLKQFEAETGGVELHRRDDFVAAVQESDIEVFDPTVWNRGLGGAGYGADDLLEF